MNKKDADRMVAINKLQKVLLDTIIALGGRDGDAAADVVQTFVQAHLENHRDYHDILHPYKMLDELEVLMKLHPELASLIDYHLMVWLFTHHDIVVKLGREKGWNEERSAEVSTERLTTLGIGEPYIGLAGLGILSSIDHKIPEHFNFSLKHRLTVELFLDFDLAGLGQSPEGFARDTEAVWREFRAIATRGEYNAGRSAWAVSFLERDRIYHTEYFAEKEKQAQDNLRVLAG